MLSSVSWHVKASIGHSSVSLSNLDLQAILGLDMECHLPIRSSSASLPPSSCSTFTSTFHHFSSHRTLINSMRRFEHAFAMVLIAAISVLTCYSRHHLHYHTPCRSLSPFYRLGVWSNLLLLHRVYLKKAASSSISSRCLGVVLAASYSSQPPPTYQHIRLQISIRTKTVSYDIASLAEDLRLSAT